jgi:hypothetical protein
VIVEKERLKDVKGVERSKGEEELRAILLVWTSRYAMMV